MTTGKEQNDAAEEADGERRDEATKRGRVRNGVNKAMGMRATKGMRQKSAWWLRDNFRLAQNVKHINNKMELKKKSSAKESICLVISNAFLLFSPQIRHKFVFLYSLMHLIAPSTHTHTHMHTIEWVELRWELV